MHIDAFDYTLPKALVAEASVTPRDSARMLILHRESQELQHRHVRDLAEFIRPGDVIVRNNTKVFKARLHVAHDGKQLELFFLRPDEKAKTIWHALLKPSKSIQPGDLIELPEGIRAELVSKHPDGIAILETREAPEKLFDMLERHGEIPTPPYVKATKENAGGYQTIYAEKTGSVAAPTAGFHLTENLIARCLDAGANFADVTLHVGLGTFRPVRAEYLHEHVMHEEWMRVPKETLRAIKTAKSNGGRVIAIGTTAVRALESVTFGRELADIPDEDIEGMTNLFITPGFPFKITDGLLTNFHLPKSTLLVLVAAFAGKEFVLGAYEKAIRDEYRFYSFGDAMLII